MDSALPSLSRPRVWLSAMIQGGVGIAASGDRHPGRLEVFAPIHGSVSER